MDSKVRRSLLSLRQLNYWLVAQLAFLILRIIRLLPADRALNFIDAAARWVGPLSGRHKVALDNIARAFPEKSAAEVAAIASDMWGNMGRLAAEYVFLDALMDYDPAKGGGRRIEVAGEPQFHAVAAHDRPNILFTAHTGSFELLPIAGAAFGMKLSALFRAPNNPYLADYILATRRSSMGDLLASRPGVTFKLARILDNGGTIGLLVDQKFKGGLLGTFFGRPCETSPLLPKLARQYDCDVYPARCRRLPGNRYRLEIEPRLDLPRTADGRVDTIATAQLLNDVVERWVRDDPGQWMWFHRRWGVSRKGKEALSASREGS